MWAGPTRKIGKSMWAGPTRKIGKSMWAGPTRKEHTHPGRACGRDPPEKKRKGPTTSCAKVIHRH
jgi:hypothetical protein